MHMMTTSRDSAKTNGFPGEVRAGEFAKAREVLGAFVRPGEAVLFCGDFNTGPHEDAVFGGRIPAAGGDPVPHPDAEAAEGGPGPRRELVVGTGCEVSAAGKLLAWADADG